MDIQEQIDDFYRFATDALKTSSFNSLEEVLDEWRTLHPESNQAAEDLAAVQAAITDLENGDRGRPASQVLNEMRTKYDLPEVQ